MKAIRTSLRTLALASAVGLFATASPAVAASNVSIDSASLVARGAAVELTYSLVCEAGTTADPFVALSQRSGGKVATAFGSPSSGSIECTGETQTVTTTVLANSGPAFKAGPAAVSISHFSCPVFEGPCTMTTFTGTVKITRR